MDLGLGVIDWAVVALYFIAIFVVAGWATYRERQGKETSADYFLAGRNVGWFVVGASLFASNIGSEHLIGLAGTGAASGIAVGQFEVMASLILLLLGWVFVPFYVKSGVYTMPEFLERRYSPAARWYLATISIIGYILTKISVTIFAGAIVFETIGVPFWTGAFIVVIVTGVYTILGGLRAVLYTDLLQMFVLIGGAVAVTSIGLVQIGGWSGLQGTVEPTFFSMWRPMSDPEFPWTGILFGAPILGIWYWCTDQFIVQRTLSAKNVDNARRGTIFAGYLKLLPVFIFVLPGMIAYGMVEQGLLELDMADQALPALVSALLPVGLRGLVVAGLLAALMSSLSSVFNSCSTMITWDVYKKMHPDASERRLVWVGRVATVVIVIFGLLWIPLMEYVSGQLYTYLQSVQSYIAPPIAAVFLLGVFWSRINAQGAITSLLFGFVVGTARLILELYHAMGEVGLTEGTLVHWFATVNFLHFAIILFVACVAVLVGVSYLTPPPNRRQIAGLTFETADEPMATDEMHAVADEEPQPTDEPAPTAPETVTVTAVETASASWKRLDLWLSVGVILLVLLTWWFFS